jgi:hypothetical protein
MSPVIEQLIRLAGPLGALGSLEEQARVREELKSGDPLGAASRLLDAVAAKTKLPASVSRADFEGTVADLLAELAEHASVREQLERVLANPALRPVAIDALALLGNPAAGLPLARLVTEPGVAPPLTDDELVGLIAALGSVAGPDAVSALELLRGRELPEAAAHELEIALESARGRR